jgi:hypothetical protein
VGCLSDATPTLPAWIRDSGRNTRFNKKEKKEKDL